MTEHELQQYLLREYPQENARCEIRIEIVVFADYTVLFLLRLSFTGSTDDFGTLPPQVWHLGIASTAFRPRKYIALNIGSTEKKCYLLHNYAAVFSLFRTK